MRASYYDKQLRELYENGALEQVVTRCHEILGDTSLDGVEYPKEMACVLEDLASAQKDLGNYDAAIDATLLMLKIDEAAFGKNSVDYVRGLSNLGYLYRRVRKQHEAKLCFDKALSCVENLPVEQRWELPTIMINMACLYSDVKRFDEAERLLLSAAKQRLIEYNRHHPKFGAIYFMLAQLYLKMGKRSAAVRTVGKAIRIYKSAGTEYSKMLDFLERASQ